MDSELRLTNESDTVTVILTDGSEVELTGDGMLYMYNPGYRTQTDFSVNLFTLKEEGNE